MTEYELDQICSRVDCDCKCMKCPYFAQMITEEWGLNEGCDEDDDSDSDDEYDVF